MSRAVWTGLGAGLVVVGGLALWLWWQSPQAPSLSDSARPFEGQVSTDAPAAAGGVGPGGGHVANLPVAAGQAPGPVVNPAQGTAAQAGGGGPVSGGTVTAAVPGTGADAAGQRPDALPDRSGARTAPMGAGAGVAPATGAGGLAATRPDTVMDPAKGATSPLAPGKAGAPSLDAIQAELQGLAAGGRQPTPMEVDRVLAKLQQNQGSSVVGGVDIQMLRNNLQAAERIRTLSEQMQPLAQNPSPENTQRLQALMTEIQQVQGTLRPDVLVKKP